MKKLIIHLLFFCFSFPLLAQTNLYIIYDPAAPAFTKDVRKYKGLRNPAEVRMLNCKMVKSEEGQFYIVGCPFYDGENLKLEINEDFMIQTIPASQVAVLAQTHHVRTPIQLDADLQPAINADYDHPKYPPSESATVKYFAQFAKIYVIEYIGNEAKIVPVYIGNVFE